MSARRPPRFEQRSLNPLLRRLRQQILRRVGKRFVHAHRVSLVRIGTRRFKRIRFGDAWLASRAATGLEHFSGSGVVPELEARFDEELLVEFVEGERLTRFDPSAAEPLASFYARVHVGGTRREATAATGLVARAGRDLAFLRDVEVVDARQATGLEAALTRLAPAEVLLGWDYTDAVPKNFVRREDGRLVGIDVEALQPDGLVGIGIAKSLARGDASYRRAFLDAFRKQSEIDIERDLPFVELCFQLRWLKNRCLKGSRLDPSGLEPFLDE